MVMDRTTAGEFSGSGHGYNLSDEVLSYLSDPNLLNCKRFSSTILNQDCASIPSSSSTDLSSLSCGNYNRPIDFPSDAASPSIMSREEDSREDYDFSDVVLKYISQILMEEDIEDKSSMFQESAALQAAEQSLYELLGEQYPPPTSSDHFSESSDKISTLIHANCNSTSSSLSSGKLVDLGWNCDSGGGNPSYLASQSTSDSQHSSSGSGYTGDRITGSPVSTLRIPEVLSDGESVMQFQRGFEEASKFIPNENNLAIDLGGNNLAKELKNVAITVQKNENECSPDGLRGKKNRLPEDVDLDGGRSSKQSSIYTESTVSSEMFDMVLLICGGENESALRETLQNVTSRNLEKSAQLKGTNSNKNRGKKKGNKRDMVDLRTLLTICAQSVATNDRRSANELLKQIREHANPMGDGMQRMAHYFANGLEARLAGSGTKIYTAFINKPTSAADILRAYHLFLAACPFRKLSNYFSNKTIMNVAQKATRLHIIDFGTLYGFQWPCLIQRLSSRPGGPPNLQMTAIDFAQPGFRPAERIEETGRRLSNYAETFKVPFEFNAIAQKWDTVKVDDLKLKDGEVVVVNCLYRFRNLLDETVEVDCPRDTVLNLIKKINPDIFVLGVVNGSYNAPFFITRFREALFHFSTLYDMLETTIPREIPERMLLEREIFGWEAMNVIACEGYERIERPETYKQWQVRNHRIGFKQLPLNEEIVKVSKDRVKEVYHKDFVIDEDGRWLLHGWKGRITYALSTWKVA